MKNKLEIKHLAAYLPYRLKMTKNGFIGELLMVSDKFEFKVSCSNWWENEYKPILRPLSDLHSNIQIGEYYMSFNEHLKLEIPNSPNWDWLFGLTTHKDLSLTIIENAIFVKLCSWHFDVFGLIDQDLAISVHDV